MAQMVKCLPTMWETRVRSLGQEVPLEKETATHSSILAWRIPWTEEPSRLQLDTTEQLHFTSRRQNNCTQKIKTKCPGNKFPFFQQSIKKLKLDMMLKIEESQKKM